ncbi:MAG TPA: hypothetical protein VI076_11015, partial [Actinopolymorphaceae bacterium]
LLGANPAVHLVDADGATLAYASVWDVGWSERGSGRTIVLVTRESVRALGPDPDLGRWLAEAFVQDFPEVADIAWSEPRVETATVLFRLDLSWGLHARAGDVTVRITQPLDRRPVRLEDFRLDGVPHELSMVYVPCRRGSITVDDEQLPGEVRITGRPERPSSGAFLTECETWRR